MTMTMTMINRHPLHPPIPSVPSFPIPIIYPVRCQPIPSNRKKADQTRPRTQTQTGRSR